MNKMTRRAVAKIKSDEVLEDPLAPLASNFPGVSSATNIT